MMGKIGKFDFSELTTMQKELERLDQDSDEFLQACARELAARLLRMVIRRTPVGVYPNGSGKTGGTLRRGWTAGSNTTAQSYADSVDVKHSGTEYVVEITNPVEYASYVEYGHRQEPGRFVPAIGKSLKRSWVPGRFMLKISEQELKNIAPKVLENRLMKHLEECLK